MKRRDKWPIENGWYVVNYTDGESVFFVTSKTISSVHPLTKELISCTREEFLKENRIYYKRDSGDTGDYPGTLMFRAI